MQRPLTFYVRYVILLDSWCLFSYFCMQSSHTLLREIKMYASDGPIWRYYCQANCELSRAM
jgi:hypothetical protein